MQRKTQCLKKKNQTKKSRWQQNKRMYSANCWKAEKSESLVPGRDLKENQYPGSGHEMGCDNEPSVSSGLVRTCSLITAVLWCCLNVPIYSVLSAKKVKSRNGIKWVAKLLFSFRGKRQRWQVETQILCICTQRPFEEQSWLIIEFSVLLDRVYRFSALHSD